MVRGSPGESYPHATQIIDVEAELHTLAIPPYTSIIWLYYLSRELTDKMSNWE